MLKLASLSVALFLSAGVASQVQAAQNDMGSRWPNEVDVSSSPNWHVYVFRRSGVEYVQVNDLNGTVRQVVASAGGQFLVLPMGADASHVATPQQQPTNAAGVQCQAPNCGNATAIAAVSAQAGVQPAQLVYRDAAVMVTVTTDTNGNLLWNNKPNKGVTADTCQPPSCVGQQQPSPH